MSDSSTQALFLQMTHPTPGYTNPYLQWWHHKALTHMCWQLSRQQGCVLPCPVLPCPALPIPSCPALPQYACSYQLRCFRCTLTHLKPSTNYAMRVELCIQHLQLDVHLECPLLLLVVIVVLLCCCEYCFNVVNDDGKMNDSGDFRQHA